MQRNSFYILLMMIAGWLIPLTAPAQPDASDMSESERRTVSGRVDWQLLDDFHIGDRLRVYSESGFLNYDEKGNIYASDRTIIEYQDAHVEADEIRVDLETGIIEASGNVFLRNNQGEVYADKVYYNYKENSGTALGARGTLHPLYFRHDADETPEDPSFRLVSEKEGVVRGASVSSCDLAVPHYRIKAHEIIIYPDERIFVRGAVIYLWEIPVFYLPYFTRSLAERSPWFFWVGYESDLGAWGLLGYTFKHETKAPPLENDKDMVTANKGQFTAYAAHFAERGPGGGLEYRYDLDYGQHQGQAAFFFLDDYDRQIKTKGTYTSYFNRFDLNGNRMRGTRKLEVHTYEPEEQLRRYTLRAQHRTRLGDYFGWVYDLDFFSDPEIYDDVVDSFNTIKRGRQMDRRIQTALTFRQEWLAAHLMVEWKDRIGRDRIYNFSYPGDVAHDFEEQPETIIYDRKDKGIRTDRWGRASRRMPQFSMATRWLQLAGLPLFFSSDLTAFNNLDKGLNVVSRADDAYVQGVDWYSALMGRIRLGNRLTWLTQLGGGLGVADREDKTFGYLDDKDFEIDPTENTPYYLVPLATQSGSGLSFWDTETFLIGTKKFNLKKDVQDEFYYGDALTQLHARLTEALSARLTYFHRDTSGDSLGDWYAEMGNRYARDDLYHFKNRKNEVTANLDYELQSPKLRTGLVYYENLIKEADLYPQEIARLYGGFAQWTNEARNLSLRFGASVDDRQIFHPTEPAAYIDSTFRASTAASFSPLHRRWYARLGVSYEDNLDRTIGDRAYSRFFDADSPFTVSAGLGGKIGPKYQVDVQGVYDSDYETLDRLLFRLQRDIHDAVLFVEVGLEQDDYSTEYLGGEKRDLMSFTDEIDIRFSISPKLPNGNAVVGSPSIAVVESDDPYDEEDDNNQELVDNLSRY